MNTQTTAAAYVPEHLERWKPGSGACDLDGPHNYIGEKRPECYVAPIGRNRDTQDSVTLSNWELISQDLDKISTHEETGIVRIGHWAYGWFEIYLVHESDSEALRLADEWACHLADYPVASEDALSQWECENEYEEWQGWAEREWRGMVAKVLQQYAPSDAYEHAYWGEELLESIDDDELYSLWYEASQDCSWSTQWGCEGCDFNLDDAAKNLTAFDLEMLLALAPGTLLPPDQQWRREPYPWLGAEPSPLAPPLPGAGA